MPAQDNELAATTSQLNLALDKEDLFCCYERSHNLLKIIKMIEASRLEGLTLLIGIYTPIPALTHSQNSEAVTEISKLKDMYLWDITKTIPIRMGKELCRKVWRKISRN